MTTPNLLMDTVPTGTLEPSAPINADLQLLDALVFLAVEDKDLATPPTTVVGDVGKRWIIPSGATGVWTGKAGQVALCTAAAVWRYFVPLEGWRARVKDENITYEYDGSAWSSATSTPVGRHMVPIMAGAMAPSASGGCSALTTTASGANQPDIVTLDFDPATQEFAQFAIPMPESWDEGTVTFKAIWSHAATTTNFGVAWELQAVAVGDDDAIATAYGTAVAVTDTGGTTNDLYISAESAAITIAGTPQPGDTVFFRVARAPANGADTLAIDARLHGIRLYLTTSSAVD